MRSTFSARVRRTLTLVPAILLAISLVPMTALADDEDPMPLAGKLASSRTFTLPASVFSDTPESSAITITSGLVELVPRDENGPLVSALSTISTTYVAKGCVYTFDESAGEFTLVNAANAELSSEGYLIVPSGLVLNGTEYPVTAIAASAFSSVDAPVIALSSTVKAIDDAVASGNEALQAFYVSPFNEAYASADGCLYTADLSRLLLIPGGKQGTVRIPSGAEVVEPEVFSHCSSVEAIFVDAGSAAFSSRNDSLYTEDGTQLLRVPAGAKSVTVAPEATSIERAAFLGCTSLKTILVEGDVQNISPEAFSREPETAFEAEEEADDDPHLEGQTSEVVTLIADDLAKADPLAVDPAKVTVILSDEASADVWELAGFTTVLREGELSEEELAELLQPSESGVPAPGLGAPIEQKPEPIDLDSVVIDEDAFAPIVISADQLDPATDDAGDVPLVRQDDELAGEPVLADAPEMNVQTMALYSASADSYLFTFDANGGEAGRVPSMAKTAADGTMPDITGQAISTKIPRRDKFVFMGFYDGSDYTTANRYYNPDFTQTGCYTTYPLTSDGLKLYAGWAPVISVDVPASVAIAVGTLSDIDKPTVQRVDIKNLSPWDVQAKSITWDTTALEGSTATLDELFTNANALRFSISNATDETEIAPGGTTTQNVDFISLPAGSTESPTVKSFDYTMRMKSAGVKWQNTDRLSNTSLYTVFEASPSNAELSGQPVHATASFDINSNGADDYFLDPVEMTVGKMPADLTMPDGSDFVPPEYYGHTFLGFYDKPSYDAADAKQYFDAEGEAVREWDKAQATVLYAGWYTEEGRVIFDANGGCFENTPSMTELTVTPKYGEPVSTVLGDVPLACWRASNGKWVTTDEWYTDPIGGERVTDFSQIYITNIDAPLRFYAHWNETNASVKVTFVPNGGGATINGSAANYQATIKLGEFMAALPTAARPGFTFDGWYTAATGGIKITATPPTLADMMLYAHWAGNDVTVSWSVGGWDKPNPNPKTYKYTDVDTIDTGYPSGGIYADMDRGDGYTFLGWYEKDADGAKVDPAITTATPLPIRDTTYYAFWNVAITWDAQGGSSVAATSVTLSDSAALGTVPAVPTRAGYTCDGWFTAPTGGSTVSATDVVYGPTTFYAQWTGIDYTVAINDNGNNDTVPGTTSVNVKQGDMPPALDQLPTRDGYRLVGFFDTADSVGGTMYYTANGTAVHAWDKASNGTLYARWVNAFTGGVTPAPPTPPAPGEPDPVNPFQPETDYPKPNEKPTILVTPGSGSSVLAYANDAAGVPRTLLSGTYHGSVMWNSTNAVPDASDVVVVSVSVYQPNTGYTFADVEKNFAAEGKYLIGVTVPSTGCFITWADLTAGDGFMLKMRGSDLINAANLTNLTLANGALVAVYADAPYKPVIPITTNPPTLEPGSGVANSFDANGGTFAGGASTTMVSSVVGQKLNTAAKPSRAGYDFAGWYTAKENGNKVGDDTAGTINTPNQSTTYYAHWTGAAFQVTLEPNAGTQTINGYPRTVSATYGVNMASVAVPTWTDHTFLGFFDTGSAKGGTQYLSATGVATHIWDKPENSSLYARWMDNKTGQILPDGELPFPPTPLGGPTIKVTPQNGSAINAEALDSANTSRTLFAGTYQGSVTWEGTENAPRDDERVVLRVDSYTATQYPLATTMSYFSQDGKYLLGFEAASTGSFIAMSDLATGKSFEVNLMGSDLDKSVTAPAVTLVQGALRAVYSDAPVVVPPAAPKPGDALVITYDAGEGSFTGGKRTQAIVSIYGQALSVPSVNPTRPGYGFDGWFTASSGGVGVPAETPGANTTYFAHWSPRTYTITFDPNGGTGGVQQVTDVAYGSDLVAQQMPSRAGYTFDGYFSTQAATGGKLYYRIDGSGARPYDIAGDATLYARWIQTSTGIIPGNPGTDPFPDIDPDDPKPGQGPTVKLTPAAGSSLLASANYAGNVSSNYQTLFNGTYWGSVMWSSDNATAPAANDDVVVTVDAYTPNTGHDMRAVEKRFEASGWYLLGFQVTNTGSFIGWDDIKNGASFTFTMKGSGLNSSATAPALSLTNGTLRAVYTNVPPTPGTTRVMNTFDAGLGKFSSNNRFEAVLSIAGQTLALPSPNPTYTGYTFDGWYTAAVGGARVDVAPAPNAPATTTTYYAHWKGDSLSIGWNQGNLPTQVAGETVNGMPSTTSVERGQRLSSVYTDGNLPTPTLSHCRFDGWFTAATGGTQVTASTIVTASTTYYAHWTFVPDPTTITFDSTTNGGTGGPATTIQLSYGEAMPTISDKPTKTGYNFTGYYDQATGGTLYYNGDLNANGKTWDKLSATATLYAQFTPMTFTVTFNANQGAPTPANATATYGQALPTPAGYTKPVRTGYTLDGWYDTSATTGGTMYVNADGVAPATATWNKLTDDTLYARWTPEIYDIDYDLDGGTVDPTTPNPLTYTCETVAFTLANPTKTGYDFVGWSGTGLSGTANTSVTIPANSNGNREYTANWQIKTYTVTYDLAKAGAEWGLNEIPTTAEKSVNHGATYTIVNRTPTLANYDFEGWTYNGTTYQPGATIANVTGNFTLTASWKGGTGGTDEPPEYDDDSWEGGTFYLYLTKDQAKSINNIANNNLTLEEKNQYFSAEAISAHAKDIADKGTQSDYYKMYEYIRDNNIMFTTNWRDVSANNNTNTAYANTGTTYNVRLIGLRQDYTNTGKTTYAGMTFQFAENGLTYYYRYNNANYNSTGWQNSELRARMNSSNATNCSPQPAGSYTDANAKQSIWNRAPQAITKNMQPVYKLTHNEAGNANNSSSAISATRDQFFLASYWEMASTNNNYSSYAWITQEVVNGTQYQYWKSKNISGNSANTTMVKNGKTTGPWSAYDWWERSVVPGITIHFLTVNSDGHPNGSYGATSTRLVVPCFCF